MVSWVLIMAIFALAFYAAYCAAKEDYPENFAEHLALGITGCTVLLGLCSGVSAGSMLIMGLLFMS
ncbi:hypothetical protein, partial [Anaerovibrio sp.]|uniref:hypothetical protein n=1 Tax=Anaerovibrio sp. TaxID=1872532 RepID=UPI003F15944B